MRMAQSEDHWRRIYKREYTTSITELFFEKLSGLGSGEVKFNGGITAICGANGVGKTTLLSALFGIAGFDSDIVSLLNQQKLKGSELMGTLTCQGKNILRNIDFKQGNLIADPNKVGVNAIWMDLSTQAPLMIATFSEMSNIAELLETVEAYSANQEELKNLSYLVGIEYEEVETYELEFGNSTDAIKELPYFKVKVGSFEYGSEAMGLGEISIHYILWQLKRISKGSLIFIEEPETFLAPKSQESLLNILAKFGMEKEIWTVLTTHSPTILTKIPLEHVRLLARANGQVKIIIPETPADYFTLLGVPISKRGIIFVEDRAAREFAQVWIGRFDPLLNQQIEIKDLGSDSEIEKALQFPETGSWLKVVGLFDGDKRKSMKKAFVRPYTFLPGNDPPEVVLKQGLVNIEMLAELLHYDTEKIHMVLASIEGMDHHDWFIELHKKLGITYQVLIAALFEVWISMEENMCIAKESFMSLKSILEKK